LCAAITQPRNIFGQESTAALRANSSNDEKCLPIEKKNGLQGYADRDGKVIIKPQFQPRKAVFSEGLALVWTWAAFPLTDLHS